MLIYRHAIVIGIVLLQPPAAMQMLAQVPAHPRAFQQVTEPPVPSDPLELITGDAQPVTEVNQRAEIISLLANAHQRSKLESLRRS